MLSRSYLYHFVLFCFVSRCSLAKQTGTHRNSAVRSLNIDNLLLRPNCDEIQASNVKPSRLLAANLLAQISGKSSNLDNIINQQPSHCDGLLLTKTIILSTAKCVDRIKYTHKYSAYHVEQNHQNNTNSRLVESPIGWTCKHPKYRDSTGTNNLGLIVLDKPLAGEAPLSSSICLWNSALLRGYLKSKKLDASLSISNTYLIPKWDSTSQYGMIKSSTLVNWTNLTRTLDCPASDDQSQFCLQHQSPTMSCSSRKANFSTAGGTPIFVRVKTEKRSIGKLVATKSELYLIGLTQQVSRIATNKTTDNNIEVGCSDRLLIGATDLSVNFRIGQLNRLFNHCLHSRR